jgi:hypothetical protein
MRADDQIHPCDAVGHKDSLTCTRDGGGGECKVVVKDKESLIATPTQPGTYRIAVTMTPTGGGKPVQNELGRVVIAQPDSYGVKCIRQKVDDSVTVRVETLRGTDKMLGPEPRVTSAGLTCDAMSGGPDHYLDFYDYWCKPQPKAPSIEVAIASPSLTRTMTVACVEPEPDPAP